MVLSTKKRKGTQKIYFRKIQFVVINIHLKIEYPQGDLEKIEGLFLLALLCSSGKEQPRAGQSL